MTPGRDADPRTDDDTHPFVVPWSEALVLRVLRRPEQSSREERLGWYAEAVRAGRIGPDAVRALVAAGYSELLADPNRHCEAIRDATYASPPQSQSHVPARSHPGGPGLVLWGPDAARAASIQARAYSPRRPSCFISTTWV